MIVYRALPDADELCIVIFLTTYYYVASYAVNYFECFHIANYMIDCTACKPKYIYNIIMTLGLTEYNDTEFDCRNECFNSV